MFWTPLNILTCYDCELEYGGKGWADFVVPDRIWIQISPKGNESGILCAACMFKRMEDLDLTCEGAFTSGPCANHNWRKSL